VSRLFPDPAVQHSEQLISCVKRTRFAPRSVCSRNFFGHIVIEIGHPNSVPTVFYQEASFMTFEQEKRAYELYLQACKVPDLARLAWFEALGVEAEVLDEIRSLLALDSESSSRSVTGLTTVVNGIAGSLPSGDELVGAELGAYIIESQVRDVTGKLKGGMGFVYSARRNDGA
jgi:hypothetical protein